MSKNIHSYYESSQLFLDFFEKSPQKVKQILMIPLIKDKIFPIFWDDETVKSPIEQIFILAFELYCKYESKQEIYLFPQSEVVCNNKKYYIDFEFKAAEYLSHLIFGDEIKNRNFKLAIECDGYEFHQKTKEQVQKDNEREFDLKMAGYDILRFSGTQIYNNPFKCAKDTYDYIVKRIGEE